MNFIFLVFILSFIAISCFYLVKAFYDLKNRKKHRYGFLILLAGMIIGVGIGITILLSFDWIKDWDPYLLGFLATFGAAIIGGLISTIIYGYFHKKYIENKISAS